MMMAISGLSANQADALKKLNEDGRVIDSIGSFEDIDKDGATTGIALSGEPGHNWKIHLREPILPYR